MHELALMVHDEMQHGRFVCGMSVLALLSTHQHDGVKCCLLRDVKKLNVRVL